MPGYKTVIIGIALLPLIPAVLVGGGFVIGLLLAGGILLVGLGAPKWWQYYNNKSLGARGRNNDIRDVMSPSKSPNDNPKVDRAGGSGDREEP